MYMYVKHMKSYNDKEFGTCYCKFESNRKSSNQDHCIENRIEKAQYRCTPKFVYKNHMYNIEWLWCRYISSKESKICHKASNDAFQFYSPSLYKLIQDFLEKKYPVTSIHSRNTYNSSTTVLKQTKMKRHVPWMIGILHSCNHLNVNQKTLRFLRCNMGRFCEPSFTMF
jgi:hypothetical protein